MLSQAAHGLAPPAGARHFSPVRKPRSGRTELLVPVRGEKRLQILAYHLSARFYPGITVIEAVYGASVFL